MRSRLRAEIQFYAIRVLLSFMLLFGVIGILHAMSSSSVPWVCTGGFLLLIVHMDRFALPLETSGTMLRLNHFWHYSQVDMHSVRKAVVVPSYVLSFYFHGDGAVALFLKEKTIPVLVATDARNYLLTFLKDNGVNVQ